MRWIACAPGAAVRPAHGTRRTLPRTGRAEHTASGMASNPAAPVPVGLLQAVSRYDGRWLLSPGSRIEDRPQLEEFMVRLGQASASGRYRCGAAVQYEGLYLALD